MPALSSWFFECAAASPPGHSADKPLPTGHPPIESRPLRDAMAKRIKICSLPTAASAVHDHPRRPASSSAGARLAGHDDIEEQWSGATMCGRCGGADDAPSKEDGKSARKVTTHPIFLLDNMAANLQHFHEASVNHFGELLAAAALHDDLADIQAKTKRNQCSQIILP